MADIIDPPPPTEPPVREEYEIKTEIDEAQQDLEQNLGVLKDVILEKVDVKARVEKVIDEKKDLAMDYAVRAREIAMDVYARGRSFVRDQPLVVIGILAGVVVVAGGVFAIRRQLAEPKPLLDLELD